jgi:hypothetical protein
MISVMYSAAHRSISATLTGLIENFYRCHIILSLGKKLSHNYGRIPIEQYLFTIGPFQDE